MGAAASSPATQWKLKDGVANRSDVLEQFTLRHRDPAFVASLLERAPQTTSGKPGGRGSGVQFSMNDGIEYLISSAAAAELAKDVRLGRDGTAAGLVPQHSGDARAHAALSRLFKDVFISRVPGSTFSGRLERRLAAAQQLLPILQALGPFGSVTDTVAGSGSGSTPSVSSSIDAPYALHPIASLPQPLSFYQDDSPNAEVLARCATACRGSTAAELITAFQQCNTMFLTVPCLSLFRSWALRIGQPSDTGILMLDLDRCSASSSLDTSHMPAHAVRMKNGWQSAHGPSESFWRCRLRNGEKRLVTRVSFAPVDAMRPSSVKLRGSTNGTLFVDLCKPQTVPASGEIDVHIPGRPQPVSTIEVVMIGCQGTGGAAFHTITKLEVHGLPVGASGGTTTEPLAQTVVSTSVLVKNVASRLLAGQFGSSSEANAALFHVMTSLLELGMVTGSVLPLLHLTQILLDLPSCSFFSLECPDANAFQFLMFRCLTELQSWRSELEDVEVSELSGVARGQVSGDVFDRAVSSGVTVSSDGKSATSTSSDAFVVINYPMSEGEYTWSIRYDNDKKNDEFSCFGVTSLPVDNGKYDSNRCMWVVRCYNGRRYRFGRELSSSVAAIHPECVLKFRLDCSTQKLYFTVDSGPETLLFDDVTGPVCPVVSFYHDNGRVSVKSPVTCTGGGPAVDVDIVGPFGKYTFSDCVTDKPRKRKVRVSVEPAAEDAAASGSSAPTPIPPPRSAPSKPPSSWNCTVCTFLNEASASKCTICDNARPAVPSSGGEPAARPWACEVCTFENSPSDGKCSMCGSDRPASTFGGDPVDAAIEAALAESLQASRVAPSQLPGRSPSEEAVAALAAEKERRSEEFAVFLSRPFIEHVQELLRCAVSFGAVQNRRFDALADKGRNALLSLLAFPVSVHVTPLTLTALSELAQSCSRGLSDPTTPPSILEVAESVLQLCACHLHRFQAVGVSPEDVGVVFSTEGGDVGLKATLLTLAQSMDSLPSPTSLQLATQVVATIDVGLPSLFPSKPERVSLVNSLLSANFSTPFPHSSPRYLFLRMLLTKCAQQPLLSTLFPSWSVVATSTSAIGACNDSLNLLWNTMARDDASAFSVTDVSQLTQRLSSSIGAVIDAHIRHILAWLPYTSPTVSTNVAFECFTTVWRHAVSGCRAVLEAASSALIEKTRDSLVVEAALTSSQVCSVLPQLALVACLLAKDRAVIELMLPGIIAIIRDLNFVCSRLPNVLTADAQFVTQQADAQVLEATLAESGDIASAAAMRDSGLSSHAVHPLTDVLRTLVSAAARMCAVMIAGSPEEEEEEHLSPWVKSDPLRAGVDVVDVSLQLHDLSEQYEVDSARICGGSWPLAPETEGVTSRLLSPVDCWMPPDWESAMASVYDASVSVGNKGVLNSLMAWKGSTVCGPHHADRTAFFRVLLSSAPARESGETAGVLLMDILHSKAKLTAVQRRNYKSSYPDCELAVLAALLRHCGAWQDAKVVLDALLASTHVDAVDISELLMQIWKRVLTVRRWLHEQKGQFDAGTWVPVGWSPEDEATAIAALPPVLQPTLRPAGSSDGHGSLPGGAEESKQPEATSVTRRPVRRRRKVKPAQCRTFDEFKATVSARALFLLTTTCAFGDTEKEWGGCPVLENGQLRAKWSSLLPVHTLKPLLARWGSSLEDVAVSEADVDLGFDEAVSVPPSAPVPASTPSSADQLKQTYKHVHDFVCSAQSAHPDILRALFVRRRTRACQRLFGLQAQTALVGAVSIPSVVIDALVHLRPALRGRVAFAEALIREGRDVSAIIPDVSAIRHHYLKSLEGSPAALQDQVQAAFIALFTRLTDVLDSAAQRNDAATGHAVVWNWALDYEHRDAEFVLRVGLLPALARMASFTPHEEYFPLVRDVSPSVWQPWPTSVVTNGLYSGTLSVNDVISHLMAAPREVLAPSWLQAHNLTGNPAHVAENVPLSLAIRLYQEAVDVMSVATPSVGAVDPGFCLSVLASRRLSQDPLAVNAVSLSSPASGEIAVDANLDSFRNCAQSLLHLLGAQMFGFTKGTDCDAADSEANDVAADKKDNIAPTQSETGVHRYIVAAKRQASALLLKELEFVTDTLSLHIRGTVGVTADVLARESPAHLPSVEAHGFRALCQVFTLYSAGDVASADLQLLSMVTACLVVGSPRMQCIALRMLRHWVSRTEPNFINAVVAEHVKKCPQSLFAWPHAFVSKPDSAVALPLTLVDLLTAKIAATLGVTGSSTSEPCGSLCQPVGPGAGLALCAVACDAVTFLRALLQGDSPVWKAVVTDALRQSLAGVAPFVSPPDASAASSPSNQAAVVAAAVACSVLGADAPVLVPGARVALSNSGRSARTAATAAAAAAASDDTASGAGEASAAGRTIVNKALLQVLRPLSTEGIVLSTKPHAGVVSVVFLSEIIDRAVSGVQELPVDTLSAVPELPFDPSAFTLSEDLLALFLRMCDMPTEIGIPESVNSRAGSGGERDGSGLPPVQTHAVWRSQLKSRAMQALQCLLQDPACAATAVSGGLFPAILKVALVPVALPQFVAVRWLQARARILRQRLLDAATGVIIGQEVAADASGTPKLSAEERRRLELAEQLVEMGLGSKDLCVTALQLNRDSVERAAEWLMGPQAMAFTEGGGLDKSQRETNPRWGAARDLGIVVGLPPKLCYHALELSNDDRNGATAWLMDHGAMYASSEWIRSTVKGATLAAAKSTKALSWEAAVDDVGPSSSLMSASSADDDRPDDATVDAAVKDFEGSRGASEAQLELASGAARTSLKPCSMVLVSSKLGEVSSLDAAGTMVTLVPGSFTSAGVSTRELQPFTGIATIRRAVSWDELKALAVSTELALATHAARRAVLSLLLLWPPKVPCSLAAAGGATALLSLTKVIAASENVFDRATSLDGASMASSPLMDLLKNQLKAFLQQERSAVAGSSSLASCLIEDCTRNVEDSTKPGDSTEVTMFESLHPHFPKCQYGGVVSVEGAKALSVSFHPQSALAHASLTFVRGSTDIAKFSASDSFKAMVVHGDKFSFKFKADSDGSTTAWGYSFNVSPMRGLQWLNEREALSDPSLMWASWLLRFLVEEVKHLVPPTAVRNRAVFGALLRYLSTPGAPFKHQVVALLTQLLSSPELLTSDPPDFGQFLALERAVASAVEACGGSVFLPWKLQQLCELCAMAKFARRAVDENRPPRVAFDPTRDVTRGKLMFISTKLAKPVVRPSVIGVNECSKIDAMTDVMDMAECLLLGARLPDRLTVAVTNIVAGLTPDDPKPMKYDETVMMNGKWQQQHDDQFVRWIFGLATSRSKSMFDLTTADVVSATSSAATFPLKDTFSGDECGVRYATLKLFNMQLAKCIHMIDMTNTDERWSLGSRLRSLGHLIFADTKQGLIDAALANSETSSCGLSCSLDNQAAFQSMEGGKRDPGTSQCLFVQGFNQLARGNGSQYRARLDERGRLFGVSFVGEDGLDWGGLYRDAISRMVEDCFSDWFDLFLPCPNNRNQTGQNMDKYLPNAKHASPRTAKMFEFFGKLVGVSMRQKLYLPFNLPSIVWKHLVGETVSMEDIQLVDEACVGKLMEMKQAARLGTREDFEREFSGTLFTVTAADGQLVELVPGGFDTVVSWDTREQYIRLAEAYKIHEFDAQLASIRGGVVEVIPERALKLCTWQELEVLVCGDPRIDVEIMKANTTYHGYDEGDRACRYFWQVMRSMDDAQRSMFVRFAWGRSRLPRGKWERPFKLSRKSGGDNQLPIAHTCFFQIELPDYSSEEIMRKRIIAAFTYGIGGFLIA